MKLTCQFRRFLARTFRPVNLFYYFFLRSDNILTMVHANNQKPKYAKYDCYKGTNLDSLKMSDFSWFSPMAAQEWTNRTPISHERGCAVKYQEPHFSPYTFLVPQSLQYNIRITCIVCAYSSVSSARFHWCPSVAVLRLRPSHVSHQRPAGLWSCSDCPPAVQKSIFWRQRPAVKPRAVSEDDGG